LLAIFTVVSHILTRLEERHPHITIEAILGGTDSLGIAIRQEHLQKLDKLLNMQWRLRYAYLETRTISIT
jgi:hypothetical protein